VEPDDDDATDEAVEQAGNEADEQVEERSAPVDRTRPPTDTTPSTDTDEIADLETLAELEAEAARLSELEAEAEALAELEAEALRLAALEKQAARVAELEQQARRVDDLEARIARLGELERQARRIAELEAQASKLPFLEAQARRVVELEAQVSRLADVEAATAKARRHRARAAAPTVLPDSAQVSQLVESFVTRADELFGVADTGEVIVNAAIEQTGADAAALLLPDGGRWRVAAGHNLRPLERRYELSDTSWLVTQVAWQRRGVIVQDTDIARRALRGAPLASWHHLLAAPIPGVQGLLLLARAQDPPFGERDLSSLVALAREAAPLIVEALSVRQLARLLSRFRDDQDNPSQL
jgi:chemotaxis protein histidine kinase CheA